MLEYKVRWYGKEKVCCVNYPARLLKSVWYATASSVGFGSSISFTLHPTLLSVLK